MNLTEKFIQNQYNVKTIRKLFVKCNGGDYKKFKAAYIAYNLSGMVNSCNNIKGLYGKFGRWGIDN